MKRRVLLCGFFGMGNAGDEAVLAAAVRMFREREPGIELAALSGDPEATRRGLEIDAAPRMSPPSVLRELRRCGLFLSGGGSLIQDRTSLRSLLYYLGLLRLARLFGVRTMVFAQGIGPLVRPASRRLAARVLAGVDAITVRDADSAQLLADLGIDGRSGPKVEVTADPAFGLPPVVNENVTAAAPGRPSIAISLRPWRGVEAFLDPLADALAWFEGRASLQAWPLYPREDLRLCEALAQRLPAVQVQRRPLAPEEWMGLAGWADAVVAMRLHALVFGAARAVPVVGLSYDPKVDALLQRLRSPLAARAGEPLAAPRLRELLEAALEEDEPRRRDRAARAEHLACLAARNVERALELLPG